MDLYQPAETLTLVTVMAALATVMGGFSAVRFRLAVATFRSRRNAQNRAKGIERRQPLPHIAVIPPSTNSSAPVI